jgi:diadenosine tetraphosphate (Ap4A) HIT family hydrolase
MTIDTGAPCPFCEPSDDRLFAQNALALALWDGFPVTSGHALIISRRHIASWFDTSESERSALFALVDAAKSIIDPIHRPDGYNIGINIGAAAGQTVFHVHIHLIPRFVGDVEDPRGGVRHVIPSKANYKADLDCRSMPDHGPSK